MHLLLSLLPFAHAEDLSVSSNVKGLSILVNGEDTGLKTPATVTGLSPGTVTVQVGDACRAGQAIVDVGSTSKVTVRAEEALATLTVQVTPPQAVVDVNHGKVKLSPNVPVGLPCGTYEITASLKGYDPTGYTLELIGGQELTLPIELDKLGMSTVELSVEPRSATLLFDGKEVGSDAASLPSVYEGIHTIGATAKGYSKLEVPIEVGDGDDLVFKISLSRGDMDGEVKAVGGAGKVALDNGARSAPEKIVVGSGSDETPSKNKRKVKEDEEPEEVADGRQPDPDDTEGPDQGYTGGDDPDEKSPPAKSWSELHGGDATDEKKPVTKKHDEGDGPEIDLDAPEAKPKSKKTALKATGGVLLGLGAVVGGGGGYYAWTQAQDAYSTWTTKQAAADDASGAEAQHLQKLADVYWTDEVAPRGNLMYGMFAGGGVLLATGIVLLVVDADGVPIIAPTPGGAMVGWSSSF